MEFKDFPCIYEFRMEINEFPCKKSFWHKKSTIFYVIFSDFVGNVRKSRKIQNEMDTNAARNDIESNKYNIATNKEI